jgi:hypothetical protein
VTGNGRRSPLHKKKLPMFNNFSADRKIAGLGLTMKNYNTEAKKKKKKIYRKWLNSSIRKQNCQTWL